MESSRLNMGAMMKTKDAIQHFGSAAKLADALGIRRSAVSQWGDDVPPLRAYQIREIIEAGKPGAGNTAPEQLAA